MLSAFPVQLAPKHILHAMLTISILVEQREGLQAGRARGKQGQVNTLTITGTCRAHGLGTPPAPRAY